MPHISVRPVRHVRPVGHVRLVFSILAALLLVGFLFYVRSGKPYVRGAWITGYGTGYLTPAQVDRTIAAAKQAKLNLLFVEVRKSADAYYKPGIEPLASNVTPGFDPLAYLVKKAHAEGIKVHAWVSVYRVYRGNALPANPSHLANRHRDWLALSDTGKVVAPDGVFIDPANLKARQYTVRVIADIVRRYDIDGLHLDFIRYPGPRWGFSKTALKRYRNETGVRGKMGYDEPMWEQWRRQQVTDCLRAIRRKVKKIKPQLLLSAATIAYGECYKDFESTYAFRAVGQDWRGWLTEGLLDANVPMDYRNTLEPAKLGEFRRWLPAFRRWGGGKPVFVGLASYASYSRAVARQIEDVRRQDLDGFAVFCFNESGVRIAEDRKYLARSLAETDSIWKKWHGSAGEFLENR
jgi:uncharacterized lipoprotein YddW (UPF0748 family)